MGQVAIAAKQAPVTYARAGDGSLQPAMSAGGTGSVVGEVARGLDVACFGSAVTAADCEMADRYPAGVPVDHAGGAPLTVNFVRHDPDTVEPDRYARLGATLWHTLHALWDRWTEPVHDAGTRRAWDDLCRLNQDFAAALHGSAPPGTAFLVHDYQLALTPGLLRRLRPEAAVLLFVHIAWPDPDTWRTLPRVMREEVLRSMLAAGTVGFFARRWVRNFLACVQDVLREADVDMAAAQVRLGGTATTVRALPLSYSPEAVAAATGTLGGELARWVARRRVIVHSGRTDPIKNAPLAIRAVRDGVRQGALPRDAGLLVRLAPHRLNQAPNSRYLDTVTSAAQEANDALGDEVVRVDRTNDRGVTLAALRDAQVVYLNSVVDGQNLTAFEASAVNRHDAPLVLSEACGAAEVAGDAALLVNPHDLVEQVEQLAAALALPGGQRRRRAALLRQRAERCTMPVWVKAQLDALGVVPAAAGTGGG